VQRQRFPMHAERTWSGVRLLATEVASPGLLGSNIAHIETTNPGVQNPHCDPWHFTIASCTGLSLPSYFKPSIVTMCVQSSWHRNWMHEHTVWYCICPFCGSTRPRKTVHEPQ